MAKPSSFDIHVDPSCLSEDQEKENTMPAGSPSPEPAERITSNETAIHDPWAGEESNDEQEPEDNQQATSEVDKEDEARERRIRKIQAEIQAAARAVVDNIGREDYDNEDSVLSARTEESYDQDESELADQENSVLTQDEGTELTYGEETELSYQSEHEDPSEHASEQGGDSSSHHDGDIDDDVFSSSNRSSARSSINSVNDLHKRDSSQKHLISPTVGEEAASSSATISRLPSGSSYIRPESDNDRTPSKIMNRPPFRIPSAVRALQMDSPAQSIFSSPRSSKRHVPPLSRPVSRLGSTHSSPTRRTPTRFKAKKENPLVLLHVTVMPLQWPYSHLMASPELPECLYNVKESWKMLQSKLGDTVLERGVLLAHPQDSYEVLEERLLEALELPVKPRAKILKCGHYMGPADLDSHFSDDLDEEWALEKRQASDWCDICQRNVRIEDIGRSEIRFRIKFYASNGLMRAGAWAAAWREMERVDVEIEPLVDLELDLELEHLAHITPVEEEMNLPQDELPEEDDGFVDEDMMIEDTPPEEQQAIIPSAEIEQSIQEINEEEVRLREEEVRSRMAEEEQMRQKMVDDERLRQMRLAEEEEMKQRFEAEERLKINRMAEELGIRQRMHRDDDMRRSLASEERIRDLYRAETPRGSPRQRSNRNSAEYFEIPTQSPPRKQQEQYEMPRESAPKSKFRGDESLSELLLAAIKVTIQDSKNIAIVLLSLFVLFLAMRPSSITNIPASLIRAESPPVAHVTTTVYTEITMTASAPPVEDLALTRASSEPSVVFVTETIAAPQVPSAALEPKLVFVTETVATTVIQEKTVTQMLPAASATPDLAQAGTSPQNVERSVASEKDDLPSVIAKSNAQGDIAKSDDEEVSTPDEGPVLKAATIGSNIDSEVKSPGIESEVETPLDDFVAEEDQIIDTPVEDSSSKVSLEIESTTIEPAADEDLETLHTE